MIYFIQHGVEGPIKIGYTNAKPSHRLSQFQAGNPVKLNLVGTMPGGESEEKELHRKFMIYRERGEWFHPSEELTQFILDNRSEDPDCDPEFILCLPDEFYAGAI